MDRRKFLEISALAAAGCALASCSTAGRRYKPSEPEPDRGKRTLITGALIVDVGKGALRPETAILISDGRIAGMFTDPGAAGVAADRTVDLGGMYVTPGLINAHCHMSLPGAICPGMKMVSLYSRQLERNCEECIKHGVTTVRDMLAIPPAMNSLRKKIREGEIVGPRIVSSCAIDVRHGYNKSLTGFFISDTYWQPGDYPLEARESVRIAKKKGASWIKLFQQPTELTLPARKIPLMDTATVIAVCEEARKAGLPVAMHHTDVTGLERGLAGGVTSLEHMVRDRELYDQEVEEAARSGAYFVSTGSVAFALAYRSPGDELWGDDPLPRLVRERDNLLPGILNEFAEPELAKGALDYHKALSDPAYFAKKQSLPVPAVKFFTAAAVYGSANMKKLYQTGAKFGCGNDGGVPFVFPGAMWLEMTLMQESGVKPAEVLRAATLTNAKILNLERSIGTVNTGRIADLAVFEKNPLEDARNLRKPICVLQAGRVVHRAA